MEVFKFATERTPRLLALKIIELEKRVSRYTTTKERGTHIAEINRLREEVNKLRAENADLIKQAKEINTILQEATR